MVEHDKGTNAPEDERHWTIGSILLMCFIGFSLGWIGYDLAHLKPIPKPIKESLSLPVPIYHSTHLECHGGKRGKVVGDFAAIGAVEEGKLLLVKVGQGDAYGDSVWLDLKTAGVCKIWAN